MNIDQNPELLPKFRVSGGEPKRGETRSCKTCGKELQCLAAMRSLGSWPYVTVYRCHRCNRVETVER